MTASPRPGLLELVQQRRLVIEGAMGTMLALRGVPAENSGERCLTHPDVVADIHRSYLEAGADLFQTNSFVANRSMLERAGLGDRVAEIQAASVQILRQAVGPDHLIGADGGPTGRLPEPYGDLTRREAVDIYREQLGVQVAEGVDFIILQTFEILEEIEAAIEAAHLVAPDLPLVTCFSFSNPNGRSMMGVDGQRAAERLQELGADVIGANCGDVEGLQIALQAMAQVTDRPLIVQANAGVPRLVEGRTVFSWKPAQSAELARRFVELGVRIIGGCCGTTPEHLAAIAQVVHAA